MRVGTQGAERPIVLSDDGSAFDLTPLTQDIDPAFIMQDGIARTRVALAANALPATDAPVGERIGAPLSRPGSIVCVGMNYAAHAAESGALPPDDMVIFFKKPNTIAGPADPIYLPPGSAHTDWEIELGVVIARECYRLDDDNAAMSAVAGYVLANELSERHHQIERSGGQWSKGKSFPGFCPLGPWLATAEEISDPHDLRLQSWVNGAVRQDSHTSDMIFRVPQIIRELSQVMVLAPGDLILTGTPEGVALSGRYPYLGHGDNVRLRIDALGEINQTVITEET